MKRAIEEAEEKEIRRVRTPICALFVNYSIPPYRSQRLDGRESKGNGLFSILSTNLQKIENVEKRWSGSTRG